MPGNAVEIAGAGEFLFGFGIEAVERQAANNPATAQVYFKNIIGLPLVGIQKPIHIFQLVDIRYGTIVVGNAEYALYFKRSRIQEADIAAAIAHNEAGAVVCKRPAL